MNKIQRIPRPLGITNLNQSNPDKLVKAIVIQWVNSNGQINKEQVSMTDLANMLHITYNQLYKVYTKVIKDLGRLVMGKEHIQDVMSGMIAQSNFRSLEAQSLILNQLGILLTAQKGKYRPFISAEVGQVLRTLLQSEKNQMDLIRLMNPSGILQQIAVFPPLGNEGPMGTQKDAQPTDILTLGEAAKLIQSQEIPLTPAMTEQGIVYGLDPAEKLPEIDNRKQGNDEYVARRDDDDITIRPME